MFQQKKERKKKENKREWNSKIGFRELCHAENFKFLPKRSAQVFVCVCVRKVRLRESESVGVAAFVASDKIEC